MRQDEVIVVSGCSRSGTSLMMRMLEAGGIQTFDGGNKTGYECEESRAAFGGRADFIADIPGQAVKLLDPHRFETPIVPIAWIWMWRDATEQARSQVKFMGSLAGMHIPISDRLIKSIRVDNERVPVQLSARAGSRVLVVDFARLIGVPRGVVAEVVGFINRPMDQDAMAACVIEREPGCAPGLDIEIARMEATR